MCLDNLLPYRVQIRVWECLGCAAYQKRGYQVGSCAEWDHLSITRAVGYRLFERDWIIPEFASSVGQKLLLLPLIASYARSLELREKLILWKGKENTL